MRPAGAWRERPEQGDHQPPVKKTVAKAPAKAAPQPTVTLKHLAAALAEDHDLSKKQAEAMIP